MKDWYISNPVMTVRVTTDDAGVILDGARIVKSFIGQNLEDLTSWLERQGEVEIKLLGEPQ